MEIRFAMIALAVMMPARVSAQMTQYQIDPARIDAVFKAYGTSTPGCALGVYNKGQVLYAKGYGMADLNLGVPIRPETVFDIGSTSKQFAAASVVLLANEGKLSLTDDVRKYVPELPNYGKVITIDHLLRHTSGIRDYNALLYMAGHFFEDYTGDDEALDLIVRQRALNFEPGSRWDYSNSGFFLLSTIVKRVTGKTLAEFSKEKLFAPLGMTVSHFRTDHTAILPNRATAYSMGEHGLQIDMSDWDQAGDGAVNTNVLELAKWDANFYAAEVGGSPLVNQLQQRGTLDNGDSLSYARGLFVDSYRGLRRVHHGGAWAGYRAMLMRFPNQALAIGVTCNVGEADTEELANGVADVVLEAAFPAKAATTPAASPGTASSGTFDATPYRGLYFSETAQMTAEIAVEKGVATASAFGRSFPLQQTTPTHLVAVGAPIDLTFADGGRTVTIGLRGEVLGTFTRTERYHPTAAELAEYAGTYQSAELGTAWTVRLEGGKLFAKGRAVGESELTAAMKDGFQMPRGFLVFTRGPNGRVNGFNLSASRMLKIRFDR